MLKQNVILFCYNRVSDSAKITYLLLDSLSKANESGMHYQAPTLAILAGLLNKSTASVYNALKQLERVNLIRIERKSSSGRANQYILLGPSQEETQRYLELTSQTSKGQ